MRDLLYVIHIQERIERIELCAQQGRDAFLASVILQDAVIRNFEVIGEAVKRLSDELKARHPSVPWSGIAGFRDVLIHQYMGVDVQAVWNVVERDLLPLERTIEAMRAELEP